MCKCDEDCDAPDTPGFCVGEQGPCCIDDDQCGMGEICVGGSVADPTVPASQGVCLPKPQPGFCWLAEDCPGGTCEGAYHCGCLGPNDGLCDPTGSQMGTCSGFGFGGVDDCCGMGNGPSTVPECGPGLVCAGDMTNCSCTNGACGCAVGPGTCQEPPPSGQCWDAADCDLATEDCVGAAVCVCDADGYVGCPLGVKAPGWCEPK